MESPRSAKAVKIASMNHSIKPVEPDNLDSSSVSVHPLYDMSVLTGFTAAPTDVIDDNRKAELVQYLESRVRALKSPLTERDEATGRIVALRTLADRMLFLAAANQADPKQVSQYLDCFEKVNKLINDEKSTVSSLQRQCDHLENMRIMQENATVPKPVSTIKRTDGIFDDL